MVNEGFIETISVEKTLERATRLKERLPKPVGYQVLAIKPRIEETTKGGIALPEKTILREESGAVCALVIALGDLAYADERRFPTGPWCKVGDFILTGAYRGSRFSIEREEFILLNDDQILGIVIDPTGLTRAF